MAPTHRRGVVAIRTTAVGESLTPAAAQSASGDLSEEQRAIGGTSGLSIQQRSCKSGLMVIFTPMSELRDFIVRRLPKQNRQIEVEPRKIPIHSRGKRACGASACLSESSGA